MTAELQGAEPGRIDDAALARELKGALERGDLTVAFQPKVNLRTGEVDALEALCRWTHPELGPIAPDRFIRLAEATGDIGVLSQQVAAAAARAQPQLTRAAKKALVIYINLSGGLVTDASFIDWILELCLAQPGTLGLEITETAVISDPVAAIHQLNRLSDAGVPLAIDDYGAGLSSLAYLRMLPACSLKIDRTFISNLKSSPRDPLIVRSTVDLAHALDMSVTAEGVEDAATLALLRLMGCDRAQGFHISAPLCLYDMLAYLRTGAIGEALAVPNLLAPQVRRAS